MRTKLQEQQQMLQKERHESETMQEELQKLHDMAKVEHDVVHSKTVHHLHVQIDQLQQQQQQAKEELQREELQREELQKALGSLIKEDDEQKQATDKLEQALVLLTRDHDDQKVHLMYS